MPLLFVVLVGTPSPIVYTLLIGSKAGNLPYRSDGDDLLIASAVDAATVRGIGVQKFVYHTLAQRFLRTPLHDTEPLLM